MSITLSVLPGEYAVWQIPPTVPLPPEPPAGSAGKGIWSVTRTPDETSVVSPAAAVPSGARVEAGWRVLAVAGPLAFTLTGVIAGLTAPLAAAGLPVFIRSTYDTDYLLVKQTHLDRALELLRAAGHQVA